jgi:hypothetical protein
MSKHLLKSDPHYALKTYFQALDHFFTSAGGFKTSKETLTKLFYYAFSDERIPKAVEIPVLRSIQKTYNSLLEATCQVQEAGMFSFLPLHADVFHPSGQPRPESYFDILSTKAVLPWDYYPRFLSRQEFINPQCFFQKFFAHHKLVEWKTLLEELFHASLLHQSVIDFSQSAINPTELQQYLFVFLECSHLIKVRHRYLFPTYLQE